MHLRLMQSDPSDPSGFKRLIAKLRQQNRLNAELRRQMAGLAHKQVSRRKRAKGGARQRKNRTENPKGISVPKFPKKHGEEGKG